MHVPDRAVVRGRPQTVKWDRNVHYDYWDDGPHSAVGYFKGTLERLCSTGPLSAEYKFTGTMDGADATALVGVWGFVYFFTGMFSEVPPPALPPGAHP